MIELNLGVFIKCDAPGCHDEQGGKLVLCNSGGFAVVPRNRAWQLIADPGGVLFARCPAHAVAVASAAQDGTTTAPIAHESVAP